MMLFPSQSHQDREITIVGDYLAQVEKVLKLCKIFTHRIKDLGPRIKWQKDNENESGDNMLPHL